MSAPTIVVTAAVIEQHGHVLVTRRLKGTHLEGLWEFPGGKCGPAEPLTRCLERELREELAVDAVIGEELYATSHAYADRTVELHFFRCELRGEPTPQIGQEMKWVPRQRLSELNFPPADAELIRQITTETPRH